MQTKWLFSGKTENKIIKAKYHFAYTLHKRALLFYLNKVTWHPFPISSSRVRWHFAGFNLIDLRCSLLGTLPTWTAKAIYLKVNKNEQQTKWIFRCVFMDILVSMERSSRTRMFNLKLLSVPGLLYVYVLFYCSLESDFERFLFNFM